MTYPNNIDNKLPRVDGLPDLFTFFDGSKVKTASDWQARRAELLDLMQFYLYGYKHPTPEQNSRLRALSEAERAEREQPAWFPGMPPIRPEAVIEVRDNGRAAEIVLDAFRVPDGADDCKCIICVGGLTPEQVDRIINAGCAYVALNTQSVYSDGGDNPRTGAYCALYPYNADEYEFDSGVLMGWCWGVSRIVDALKNQPELGVDWRQCAVTGCSRNGKAAVLSAAFDERIAIAAPSDPGGGGLSGFRYSTEGQFFRGADEVYSRNESTQRAIANPDESAWFCSRAQMWAGGDNYLRAPFDMHAVAAVIAPRPLICWTGEALQAWLNSPSTVLNCKAAAEVYELLAVPENIGCVVRDGPHAVQDRDLTQLLDIMAGKVKPAELSRSPYDLENQWIRRAGPGKPFAWSYDKYLCQGVSRTVTVYTQNGESKITLDDPQPPSVIIKVDGASVELAVLTRKEATRWGLNLVSGSPNGIGIGFGSPLISTPTVRLDGQIVSADIERYGVRVPKESIPDKERFTLTADNVYTEALPDEELKVIASLRKTTGKDWFGNDVSVFEEL
jgi:hypothetical protein